MKHNVAKWQIKTAKDECVTPQKEREKTHNETTKFQQPNMCVCDFLMSDVTTNDVILLLVLVMMLVMMVILVTTHEDRHVRVVQNVVADGAEESAPDGSHAPGAGDYTHGALRFRCLHYGVARLSGQAEQLATYTMLRQFILDLVDNGVDLLLFLLNHAADHRRVGRHNRRVQNSAVVRAVCHQQFVTTLVHVCDVPIKRVERMLTAVHCYQNFAST